LIVPGGKRSRSSRSSFGESALRPTSRVRTWFGMVAPGNAGRHRQESSSGALGHREDAGIRRAYPSLFSFYIEGLLACRRLERGVASPRRGSRRAKYSLNLRRQDGAMTACGSIRSVTMRCAFLGEPRKGDGPMSPRDEQARDRGAFILRGPRKKLRRLG